MSTNFVAATIEFDKHNRTYTAGDRLTGLLSVDRLSSNVIISSVSMSLKGETRVSWHDTLMQHSDHEINLCDMEDYTKVYEKIRNDEEQITKVPFNLWLPADLPSSIESKFGSTRYVCIVQIGYISKENKSDLETFEFPFTILARRSGL